MDLSVWGVGTTLHYSYPIQLNSASFDLKPPDKIVLTIKGRAGPEAHGHPPSGFSFTITVEFSLLPSGPTVSLLLGQVSVDTSSTLAGILDYFTGRVTDKVRDAVANAFANTNANALLDNSFNADKNLTNFLNAQLSPSDGSTPAHPTRMFMVYNSVEVQAAGIVLHGSLLTYDWPAPYIQFEQIPPHSTGPGGVVVSGGTDYSALKTWIPGGTVAEYDWSMSGSPQPFSTDNHKFVLLGSGPVVINPNVSAAMVTGYSALCLTVKGSRISNFGTPATFQQVQAKSCGFTTFPVGLAGILANPKAAIPMVAVTQPGPTGGLVVTGHTPIQIDRSGAASPNLVVHFADAKSATALETLSKAFSQSKRTDASTAIVAVLPRDHVAKAPHVPGVIYTDDAEAWQHALNLKSAKSPLTAIVGPRGGVAWHEEGPVDSEKLAAALAKHLVKRGPVQVRFPHLHARIGQPAPNFAFEYAPGRTMPLSKLSGKPAVLVFWKSSAKASIQAIRDLQTNESSGTAVLAINDGEDPKVAVASAKENGITATVVTDPKREIGAAYGVNMWPTILTVSESGVISGIKHGHAPGEKLNLSPRPVPTATKGSKQK